MEELGDAEERIVTEIHIRDFLNQFAVDELTSRGILRGSTRLLNRGSVLPLITLMTDKDIVRLEAPERDWFLTSDGAFQNLLSTEAKSGRIEGLANPGNVFNQQNTSINPHYVRSPGPELDSEQDSEMLKFGLERDMQEALRANIDQLEAGLRIVDDGIERTVEAGRIDITAEDPDGRLVIIELKAGTAELSSIGQLLSYMGSVNSESSRPVRGVLVANEFHPRLIMAARAVPNLSLVAYSFLFSFSAR